MKTSISISTCLICLAFLMVNSCRQTSSIDKLYSRFVTPDAEAKPFVRWWWNGNMVEKSEIRREINILSDAGFGGVEINPIALPEEAEDVGIHSIPWISSEWNELLAYACETLHDQDMIADLIVGSGWPFGGRFLNEDQYIQKLIPEYRSLKEAATYRISIDEILSDFDNRYGVDDKNDFYDRSVAYVKLIPVNMISSSDVVDITEQLLKGSFEIETGEREYILSWAIRETGFREVMYGAKGADGPTMDHYRKEVALAYLERLKKIEEDTGIPLHLLVRALFCDSIELAGSNWSQGFLAAFKSSHGYSIEPWFPFILSRESLLPPVRFASVSLLDSIRRARYDYSKFLVREFLDNFTYPIQEYCTMNGLQFRYQGYGHPWLMGIAEGNMIPDIPESNNWIYSASPFQKEYYTWNVHHGFMGWNEYASSGGHLTGRNIISCEAMTNTRGVFQTTLETIKQADDMNFITGINHSVIHGFNYSPPEAGFPGWIRFGAYFSEMNSWWPYIHQWTRYNARLSSVFQHTDPMVDIAILGPAGDVWSENGLDRGSFHMTPWYIQQLWQPISQCGNASDMISEKVIREGTVTSGRLEFGPMSYSTLMLCGVKGLHPETIRTIHEFVKSGGTLVIIGAPPVRTLSMSGIQQNSLIRQYVDSILNSGKRVFQVNPPEEGSSLLSWYMEQFIAEGVVLPIVGIDQPDPALYQLHHKKDGHDIWFFVNTHRKEDVSFTASFPESDQFPHEWNPETGERFAYLHGRSATDLDFHLGPMESKLIVFENRKPGNAVFKPHQQFDNREFQVLKQWEITYKPVNGLDSIISSGKLNNLLDHEDGRIQSFAGEIVYRSAFDARQSNSLLLLAENVHHGITQLRINGKDAGTRWYGKHQYDLTGLVQEGINQIELIYTGVLSNYCKSLDDNPVAQRWSENHELIKQGIEGPVTILLKE